MSKQKIELDWKLCMNDVLSTHDPYDIWKTNIGFYVKRLFNKDRVLGTLPAAILTILDATVNNRLRLFYTKQEYPIVRAQAALVLLAMYEKLNDDQILRAAKVHLDWLASNYSKGYAGPSWGLNFAWASVNAKFSNDSPFITHTSYPLEAMDKFHEISGSTTYAAIIASSYEFISSDLTKYVDSDNELCVAYSPVPESRHVINASSYAMFALRLIYKYRPNDQLRIKHDVNRLYNFISNRQNSDGSWWYFADDGPKNFIDCFHSCFVIKNILKTGSSGLLPDSHMTAARTGYRFLVCNLRDSTTGLFKRFANAHIATPTKFDLYDNAEMLNLATLLGDEEVRSSLSASIAKVFIDDCVYSVIDRFGRRLNRNMLRWAVMPYLHSLYANSIRVGSGNL